MNKLDNRLEKHINLLISRYPALKSIQDDIISAYLVLEQCYLNGGEKLLIAGNGGSAADSEHIVGELMKSFVLPRKSDISYAQKLIEIDAEMGAVLAENLQGAMPAIALNINIR